MTTNIIDVILDPLTLHYTTHWPVGDGVRYATFRHYPERNPDEWGFRRPYSVEYGTYVDGRYDSDVTDTFNTRHEAAQSLARVLRERA